MAGVSVLVITRMVRRGELAVHRLPDEQWPQVHVDDLPRIAARQRRPPVDPTADQIRKRCAEVRRVRLQRSPHEIQRQKILRLFARHPQLTIAMLAQLIGFNEVYCSDRLNELHTTGLIDCMEGSPRKFCLAGMDVDTFGLESAESILSQFRERAAQRSRSRRPVTAAA